MLFRSSRQRGRSAGQAAIARSTKLAGRPAGRGSWRGGAGRVENGRQRGAWRTVGNRRVEDGRQRISGGEERGGRSSSWRTAGRSGASGAGSSRSPAGTGRSLGERDERKEKKNARAGWWYPHGGSFLVITSNDMTRSVCPFRTSGRKLGKHLKRCFFPCEEKLPAFGKEIGRAHV